MLFFFLKIFSVCSMISGINVSRRWPLLNFYNYLHVSWFSFLSVLLVVKHRIQIGQNETW